MEEDFGSRSTFIVENHVWNEMIHHCFSQLPFESCGLLSGKRRDTAATLWVMKNIRNSPVEFEMDPDEVMKVLQLMESKGENLVGIYHSHPTAPPEPSSSDIENALESRLAYFIISFASGKPNVRCYCIENQKVYPVAFQVI